MWGVLSVGILIAVWRGAAERLESREFTPLERREYLQAVMDDPDTNTLDRIAVINEVKHVGGLFEGDMVLTKKDKEYVDMREDGDTDGPLNETSTKRSMQRDRSSLWRTRRIPYVIDQALVDAGFDTAILESIAEVKRVSCVQWVKRTFQNNYVKFVKKDGCWSYVGNIRDEKGFQELSIGDGCETTDTILHEMFHAMGFYHEQSRPDRNIYVEILWENVQKGQKENFNKYKNKDVDYLSSQYDYNSIMHYGKLAFSKNGQPTIRVVGGKDRNFGAAKKLSDIDKLRLNALYECANKGGGWSSWSGYGPCDLNCEKTRQRFCFERNMQVCPGADEYGIATEYKSCSRSECSGVINGHWGRWSAYTKCTATCGKGTRTRKRLCNDPTPQKGGKTCGGSGVETAPCPLKPCRVKSVKPGRKVLAGCSFDSEECDWHNDEFNSDNCGWTRKRGGKTSPSGTSHQMVLDAAACSDGDYSRYDSKELAATSGSCLSFLYRKPSANTGSLAVIIYNDWDGENEIWNKQGGTGNRPQLAKVNIKSSSKFTIFFEAVIHSTSGTMEIDDVMLTEGRC